MKIYPELTNRQKSIIIGTALGDGNICLRTPEARNAVLNLVQGERQRDYLEWKASELHPLVTQKTLICPYLPHRIENRIMKGGISYRTRSRSHPFLTNLYNELYHSGKKLVSQSYLDSLDPLAIAVWYMDDGSLSSPTSTQHNLIICTNAFDLESNRRIVNYFQSRLGVHFGFRHSRGNVELASTDKQSIVRFVNIVKEHILPLFEYKVRLNYRS